MGQVLQKMGYCRTGHVVVATRDGRVSDGNARDHPKTGTSGLDVGHSIRSYYKDVSIGTCPFSSMIL